MGTIDIINTVREYKASLGGNKPNGANTHGTSIYRFI